MARLPNVHPGDVLKQEFLEPLEMTAYQLAKALCVQQTAISQVLQGKRAVTALMALRLARYFGTSPQFWLNLQAAYDLREVQDARGAELETIRPREPAGSAAG